MRIRNTFFLILAFVSISCSQKTFDTKEEMMEYIKNPENGYFQEKVINGVYYSLLYKPIDLLVEQEINTNKEANISKVREQYSKYMYFSLSMSKNGQELLNSRVGSRAEFGAMVNQLAFDMDKKVHVYTQKKDTLALLDYIYPRTYGMTPKTSMLFVYPREEKYLKDNILNFTIEDLGFYTGEVRFKIKTKKVKNEPILKL